MKLLRNALIVSAVAAIGILGWVAIRWNAPPLGLVQAANLASLDVQTLGEYPTTVKRIRLLDVNRAVVWEVLAQGRAAQIRGLALRPGKNPSQVDAEYGTYRVVAPKGADFFILSRGMKYTIEFWGGDSVLSRRSAAFVLGK
jgi:hypothetical protein